MWQNLFYKLLCIIGVLVGVAVMLILYMAGMKNPEPFVALGSIIYGVAIIWFLLHLVDKYEDYRDKKSSQCDTTTIVDKDEVT